MSPAEKSDSAYALITVTTKDGRSVTGVKRRETDEESDHRRGKSLPRSLERPDPIQSNFNRQHEEAEQHTKNGVVVVGENSE